MPGVPRIPDFLSCRYALITASESDYALLTIQSRLSDARQRHWQRHVECWDWWYSTPEGRTYYELHKKKITHLPPSILAELVARGEAPPKPRVRRSASVSVTTPFSRRGADLKTLNSARPLKRLWGHFCALIGKMRPTRKHEGFVLAVSYVFVLGALALHQYTCTSVHSISAPHQVFMSLFYKT